MIEQATSIYRNARTPPGQWDRCVCSVKRSPSAKTRAGLEVLQEKCDAAVDDVIGLFGAPVAVAVPVEDSYCVGRLRVLDKRLAVLRRDVLVRGAEDELTRRSDPGIPASNIRGVCLLPKLVANELAAFFDDPVGDGRKGSTLASATQATTAASCCKSAAAHRAADPPMLWPNSATRRPALICSTARAWHVSTQSVKLESRKSPSESPEPYWSNRRDEMPTAASALAARTNVRFGPVRSPRKPWQKITTLGPATSCIAIAIR